MLFAYADAIRHAYYFRYYAIQRAAFRYAALRATYAAFRATMIRHADILMLRLLLILLPLFSPLVD